MHMPHSRTSKMLQDVLTGHALVLRHETKNGIQCADAKKIMGGHRQPLAGGLICLKDDVTPLLVNFTVAPRATQDGHQLAARQITRQLHCLGEHKTLVPHEVQPNTRKVCRGMVEVIATDRLLHIITKTSPAVGLGDNGLSKALGDETTVVLLGHFENEVLHAHIMNGEGQNASRSSCASAIQTTLP